MNTRYKWIYQKEYANINQLSLFSPIILDKLEAKNTLIKPLKNAIFLYCWL